MWRFGELIFTPRVPFSLSGTKHENHFLEFSLRDAERFAARDGEVYSRISRPFDAILLILKETFVRRRTGKVRRRCATHSDKMAERFGQFFVKFNRLESVE